VIELASTSDTFNVDFQLNGSNSFVSTYNGSSDSYGIYTKNAIQITESGSLIATGGRTSADSYGIYIDRAYLLVNGGSLTAIGGESTGGNSCGIYTKQRIFVRSGSLTATGGRASGGASYGVLYSDLEADREADIDFRSGNIFLSGETAAESSGLIDVTIAAVDAAYADGRAARRVDNTEIDLSTVKYFKTYSSEADYLVDYPPAEPEVDTSIPPHLIPQNMPYGYQTVFPLITPIVEVVENFDVTAILNSAGSVDSNKTRVEIIKAARTKGVTQITLILPENCKGISTAAIKKLLKAAGDLKLFLTYDGVTVELNEESRQILTGDYFGIDK
jgi:hypothetical protein